MKGTVKRLTVLVIVVATAMFTLVATASADSSNSPLLRGTYAISGTGNCVVSPMGFDQNLNPNGAGVDAVMQIWDGDYTFDGHGSGSFTGTFRTVNFTNYSVTIANASWKFKYEMTDHNRFQMYLPDLPGYYDTVTPVTPGPLNYFNIVGPSDGVVERDGAAITATFAPPQKSILCIPDASDFCVNIADMDSPPPGVPPIELLCGFSHVGLRVVE